MADLLYLLASLRSYNWPALAKIGLWPGLVLAKGSCKVPLAGRASMLEVNYLEPPPTQAFGQ